MELPEAPPELEPMPEAEPAAELETLPASLLGGIVLEVTIVDPSELVVVKTEIEAGGEVTVDVVLMTAPAELVVVMTVT